MDSLLLGMSEIRVKDKIFQPYIDEETLALRVEELSEEINTEYAGKDPLLVPVLNGAFLFAADLIRGLQIEPEIQFFGLAPMEIACPAASKPNLSWGKILM